jgi:hypothetical protein
MKQEIAKYVVDYDTCHRVKADHLRTTGNLYLSVFLNGNGNISVWISSWVYPSPCVGMTRYRSLWTIVQSRLTFYLLAQGIGLGNM